MNKTELIETLSGRLGDRKSAIAALDAVLAEIQNAVTKGDKVSITGFGVFEKRVRAARTARNPRTGESVKVKKTSVPAFRPGAGFKELVAAGKLPKAAKTAKTAAPAKKTTAGPVKTLAAAAKRTAAAPVKTLAASTRKTAAAPAKASATRAKAGQTTASTKVAAPARKMARAAANPTPRSTATVPTAAKKAPARSARTAAK